MSVAHIWTVDEERKKKNNFINLQKKKLCKNLLFNDARVGAMEFCRTVKVIKEIIFEININSSLAFNPLRLM